MVKDIILSFITIGIGAFIESYLSILMVKYCMEDFDEQS